MKPGMKEGLERIRRAEFIPVEGPILASMLELISAADELVDATLKRDEVRVIAAFALLNALFVTMNIDLDEVKALRQLKDLGPAAGSA